MNVDKKYEELRSKDIPVYSISRLNTYNDCPYSYYKTYIERDRGDNNCYGIAGSRVHDWLEDIQNNKIDSDNLPMLLDLLLMDFEMNEVYFPSKLIGDNWKLDMKHFAKDFKRLDVEGATEQRVLYKVSDEVWLQGYIDLMGIDENDDLFILDWKTSGMFTGKRLKESGRQLLLYKDAVENMTGKPVKDLYWYMIKYIEVEFDDKRRILSRRNWVEKSKTQLKKALEDEDDFVAEMYIAEAIRENSIKNLPRRAVERFKISPHIKPYPYNDDLLEESREYVINTAKAIENEISMFKVKKELDYLKEVYESTKEDFKYMRKLLSGSKEVSEEDEYYYYSLEEQLINLEKEIANIELDYIEPWQPCDVKKNNFFCQFLCNHRNSCKYLRAYLDER